MTTKRNRSELVGGIIAVLCGAFFIGIAVLAPQSLSKGVPWWIGASAGGVFLLAGIAILRARRGGSADGLANRVLIATLLTLFAAVAMVFPPGGIFVAFLAVNAWLGVYRGVHQRAWGRDPLGHLSQEKQLGVGCLVTIALVVLVIGVAMTVKHVRTVEPLSPEAMPGESR